MPDGFTAGSQVLAAGILSASPQRSDASAQTDVSCKYTVNVERTLLENLSTIEGIVRQTCIRRGFRDAVAEEFSSLVQLRLIENDYAILRKFQGRSHIRTYLITVIQRLALDFQAAQLGKWRPSIHAQRAGQLSVELETLLYRDHLSFEEACQTLLHKHPACTLKEVEEIASNIAPRESLRPQVVGLETEAENSGFLDHSDVPQNEKHKIVIQIESLIQQIITSLPEEDRVILRLKFESGLGVAEIAPLVDQPAKKLYRKIDSIVRKIRNEIESRKISFNGIETSEMAKYVQFTYGEKK